MNILEFLVEVLLPPYGVYKHVGLRTHFWINIILTLAGYIPGVIHAIWVVLRYFRRINK